MATVRATVRAIAGVCWTDVIRVGTYDIYMCDRPMDVVLLCTYHDYVTLDFRRDNRLTTLGLWSKHGVLRNTLFWLRTHNIRAPS